MITETAVKSGKQIERCVISTFQIAESMGSKRLSPMGGPAADWRITASCEPESRANETRGDEQDSLGLCLRPLIANPSGSRLTAIRDGEQIEPMDEKRLPIDYLFRVRDDLDMILQRKPKAPDLIYDACEAALPHVCAAIGYLDSTPPNQNDRRNEQPLRNFEEKFKLPKEPANDLHYKISEWLAGRSRNERIARDLLRFIRNDLREAERADDFVRLEIDEALRDICCAIGRLIPQGPSVHDLDEPT